MYLVEYKSIHEYVSVAVDNPRSLLDFILILDKSDRIEWWKIVNHIPSHFGWSDNGWNKLKGQCEYDSLSSDVSRRMEFNV